MMFKSIPGVKTHFWVPLSFDIEPSLGFVHLLKQSQQELVQLIFSEMVQFGMGFLKSIPSKVLATMVFSYPLSPLDLDIIFY